MKKTILILLVTVFCGFQFAEAQSVQSENAVKTEVKAEVEADASSEAPAKLTRTNAKTASGKACCSSKMASKGCCSSAKASGKSCTKAQKAACSHSKVKMASTEAKTEEEVKTSVQ